jgi:hypothetical protein
MNILALYFIFYFSIIIIEIFISIILDLYFDENFIVAIFLTDIIIGYIFLLIIYCVSNGFKDLILL